MPRTLVVTQNITLDGVIEATGDWFGPADDRPGDTDQLSALRDGMTASDALLVGRQTFTDMRSFWPEQTHDATGITAHLNQVAKFVVSRTLTDPQWQNSTVLAGSVEDEVRTLTDAPGRDIVVTGSIRLTHELIRLGLVDEFRLFVYPVILGHGRRLFEGDAGLPRLTLDSSQSFGNGVVLSVYRTAAS